MNSPIHPEIMKSSSQKLGRSMVSMQLIYCCLHNQIAFDSLCSCGSATEHRLMRNRAVRNRIRHHRQCFSDSSLSKVVAFVYLAHTAELYRSTCAHVGGWLPSGSQKQRESRQEIRRWRCCKVASHLHSSLHPCGVVLLATHGLVKTWSAHCARGVFQKESSTPL